MIFRSFAGSGVLVIVGPVGYLITFGCYGSRLHGDSRGAADRNHRVWGTAWVGEDAERRRMCHAQMRESPYSMDRQRQRLVLASILDKAHERHWLVEAGHVRNLHTHVVVRAPCAPEPVLQAFKAAASERLNLSGLDGDRQRRWARHGSTVYLWDEESVSAAIDYVLNRQGTPMTLYRRR